MDVATITMPADEARRRLRSYERALSRRTDPEYQQIAVALDRLTEGTPLLVMTDAFRLAPRDDKGRPRLGLARADRRQVRLMFATPGTWRAGEPCTASFSTEAKPDWRPGDVRYRDLDLRIDLEVGPADRDSRGFSLVPIVPPDVLGRRALQRCFILWEVDAWAESRIGAVPDRDPFLLERVGGDLWAVVGEWDLTDVERAIMRGRAGTR